MLLLENGPAFSVLVSQNMGWSVAFEALELSDAFQLRIEEAGQAHIRHFETVRVYQDKRSLLWTAYAPNADAIFSCPSKVPYVLIDIPRAEHERLRQLSDIVDDDGLFGHCRDAFGRLPGFFSPEPTTLVSPADYACAWNGVRDLSRLL